MESVSPAATKDGKRASKISLEGLTSKAAGASFGNCLVLEDYVGADGEPSHIYDGGAGSLKFPKGAVSLMNYTGTGLYMSEQAATGEDKHSPCLVLRLRRWDETSPQQDDIAKFFAETLTVNKEEESARVGFAHVATSSACFIQDSNPSPDEHQIINGITHWGREIGPDNEASFLQFEDLLPTGKAEQVMIRLHHKQSSELRFEQLNKEKADMLVSLSHKNESKLVMEDFPGKGTAEFPKGALTLKHYTNSGLYITETEMLPENHKPKVQLKLKSWDKRDDEDPISQFYAEVTSKEKEKESSIIGFDHAATESSFWIADINEKKDEHKITCGIRHYDSSFLRFEDMTDKNNEQVDIILKHKKDCWL